MITWKCDSCGKETLVNPPTEPLFEDKPYDKKIPSGFDEKGNVIYKTEKGIAKAPKMGIGKRQNPQTGAIEEYPIQEVKDLKPRAYIVALSAGNDRIQKDFCKECLESILPEIKALYNKLATFEDK